MAVLFAVLEIRMRISHLCWAPKDPTHVYISQRVASRKKAATEPLDGDYVYVLDTVYERCISVVPPPTRAPPVTDRIAEGTLHQAVAYKGWIKWQIYLGDTYVDICADNWGRRDARVFCRQTFGDVLASTEAVSSADVLNVTIAPVVSGVSFNCTGRESNLVQCATFPVSSCTRDMMRVLCKKPSAQSSKDTRALDYGLGIAAGVAGLAIILIVVYVARRVRQRATKFSSEDIASMQLGQPKSWWQWTPLNEPDVGDREELMYSDQISYDQPVDS